MIVGAEVAVAARMRSFVIWVLSPWFASFVFWSVFGACVDVPPPEPIPQAKLVATWDPLRCGSPHRVALELEDDDGAMLSLSAPCTLGGLTLDVPHFGVYRGRVYAWTLGEPERTIAPVQLAIDEAIVRLTLSQPP
jgi:hypothetical protein